METIAIRADGASVIKIQNMQKAVTFSLIFIEMKLSTASTDNRTIEEIR
jgi:hypothetical protein